MNKSTQVSTLDKTTLLIMYYYVQSLNGVLGRTHLQKLLFLTDLLSSKKFGLPISKLKYIKYTHGPYSRNLNDYIEELEKKQLVIEKKFQITIDPRQYYSRFHVNKQYNSKDRIIKELGLEKVMLLDEVVQSYGNKSLQEVLNFVYSLEEVDGASFASPIELAKTMSKKEGVEELDEEPDFPL